MRIYDYAMEKSDIRRIEKLNELNNKETFWNDVRKLCRRVESDHSLRHWQALAEIRYEEIREEV